MTSALTLARRLRVLAAAVDEDRVLAEAVGAGRELLAAEHAVVLLPARGGSLAPWRPGGAPAAPAGAEGPEAPWRRALAAGVVHLDGSRGVGPIPVPEGAAMGLAAPLPGEDGPLGVLAVGRTVSRTFSPADEEVLAELAAHVGVGLSRARRHGAASRRADRIETLVRLSPRLAEPRTSEALLRLIVEEGRSLLGASAAACRLVDGAGLRLAAAAGSPPDLVGPAWLPRGEGLCGAVVIREAPILIAGGACDARGVGSYLGVPILRRGTVSGVLSVYATDQGRFGEEDKVLLGAFAGLAAVALDNIRLVRELLDAERLSIVGRIVAGVAHELNNPLAVVIGTTELLRTEAQGGPLADRLQRIGEHARRAVKIARALLALARREPSQRVPVDLPPLLDETLDLDGYELRSTSITVVRRYEEGLPPVAAEAAQLQQLFTNLVLNAVQAIRGASGHGTLTVTARHDRGRGRVVVAVADDGPGVAPADLERVFEAFYTTKSAGQGTGLGLAICRQIVEAHGGEIRAESRPSGGACFVVELPAYRGPEADVQTAAEPGTTPVRARALLVEDERVVGDLLTEFLAVAGYEVDRAENGREALDQVRRRSYALIVSDVRMPDVDGPALYRELQVLAPELTRRMVFVTGDIMSPDTRRFLDETRLRHLEKPFTLAEFHAVIRGVVQPSAVAGSARPSD